MSSNLKNMGELQRAYKKFIKASKDDIANVIERSAIKFFQQLILNTAKDTGRARNGWLPIIDGPTSEWKPPKGLSNYSIKVFDQGVIKFDSRIWIVNNVEYIEFLDEGHSSQYPEGFTSPAVRATIVYIERRINKLNKEKYNV